MRQAAALLLASLLSVVCVARSDSHFLFETFSDDWDSRWTHSEHEKYNGRFLTAVPDGWDKAGLKVPEASKHYGLAHVLSKPVDPSEGLVLQYEVKFTSGITCGGAYLKLLTHDEAFKAGGLTDTSPYTIMFGPDKCGGTSKVHLILRHKSPKTGEIEEKHLVSPPSPPSDRLSHVYTLIIKPDNTYEVLVDGERQSSGSLLEKLAPSINPPAVIPDKDDKKPADWVDAAKVADPNAVKPADWVEDGEVPDESAEKPEGWEDDEPSLIVDPSAEEPADWDEEEDGEWSPPQIKNPKCKVGCGKWVRPTKRNPAYKGPWNAPLIDNPAFKGNWVQKTIPNPDFFEDPTPLKNIGLVGAVAIEIWTVDSGYVFDHVLLTQDPAEAESIREDWKKRHEQEEAAHTAKSKLDAAATPPKRGTKDVVYWITWLFTEGPLHAFRPWVQGYLDQIDRTPWIAYFTVGFPIACLLAAVLFNRPSHKRKAQPKELPQAKRKAEPKDTQSSDEEERSSSEESEQGEEEQVGGEPAEEEEAAAATTDEIQGEEEDEPKAKPRKRISRKA